MSIWGSADVNVAALDSLHVGGKKERWGEKFYDKKVSLLNAARSGLVCRNTIDVKRAKEFQPIAFLGATFPH